MTAPASHGRAVRRTVAALGAGTGLAALHASLAGTGGRAVPEPARVVDGAVAAVEGGRFLLLGAGLVLLLAVRPLLRGYRVAWTATVASLTVVAVAVPTVHPLPAAVVPAVAAGVAACGRGSFPAHGDPAPVRRRVLLLAGGALLLLTAWATAGLYLADRQFRGGTTLAGSLADAVRLLLMLPVSADPATRHAAWLVEAARLGTLVVVLAAVGLTVASAGDRPRRAEDERDVRRLLEAYATTSLAHFDLLPDKSWLFTADRRAFLGYGVSRGTAVVLGGPVGPPDAAAQAVADFLDLCRRTGRRPAFHQVTEAELTPLRDAGLTAVKIGEVAVVDAASFTLEGPAHKALRSAVRRCERAGYRVVELSAPLGDDDLAQLREVSDAWLAAGGHRERTFTLGRFDDRELRCATVLAVVDAAGRVQAFADLLPRYRSEDLSFDLMRRRPDSVNGVMDLLFVALIARARADGARGLDLGMAPFAGLESAGGAAARLMRLLYEHPGRLFNYAGLRTYKDKWGPHWEPRYLAVPGVEDLPAAALAVARLGELPGPGRWTRAAGLVRRHPVTTAFLAVQSWLMVSSSLAPQVHAQLLAAAGSSWDLLARGQLWRLLTSPVVQAGPGVVWVNLLLGALAFPWAEQRLGSRRTAVVFFLGDLVGSVPVLLGTRLLAALGVGAATAELPVLDGGSSAGTWALLGAAVWCSTSGRHRRAAVAGLLAVLVLALGVDRGLADVQHLASVAGTLAALRALGARALPAADRGPVPRPRRAGVRRPGAGRWPGRGTAPSTSGDRTARGPTTAAAGTPSRAGGVPADRHHTRADLRSQVKAAQPGRSGSQNVANR